MYMYMIYILTGQVFKPYYVNNFTYCSYAYGEGSAIQCREQMGWPWNFNSLKHFQMHPEFLGVSNTCSTNCDVFQSPDNVVYVMDATIGQACEGQVRKCSNNKGGKTPPDF